MPKDLKAPDIVKIVNSEIVPRLDDLDLARDYNSVQLQRHFRTNTEVPYSYLKDIDFESFEIDVLQIRIRDFGVRAKMALELDGIVVARQIEIVEARNNFAVHDLHDVGCLQIFRHPIDCAALLGDRRR